MTGNSMKSDLLVESRNRITTNTTDGRQQGFAIIPGHTNSSNNNNNNTNQTIGISSTSTNSSSSSSHSNTRMIMSHINSSVENGGDIVAGTNNIVSPDLTLAIQENLKYGVGLSGLGRELLSRDTNRPHPTTAATTTISSEGIRSSSISIHNNNTSNNSTNTNSTTTTTTTTNNNNNNGLYENGSSSDGNILLQLPTTTGDSRGAVATNMTPTSSLYVAFSNPASTSSTSSSTTITGSVTTINSYNNNNNHNGTAAHPTSLTEINKNNNNRITNTTSPDLTSSGDCVDPSSNNNVHNNNINTGGTSTSTLLLLPLSTSSDPYPLKQQCPVTDNTTSESKLKELLLLHIDFIHHQQDLLLQKDRENGHLKSENETLKCRLDRMERRLSILKQKGEPVNSHHHHHHHHMPKNQANSDALTTSATTTGDRGNKKFNFLKRRERKFGVDAQNLQKKKGSETTPKSKSQSLTKNRLSYRSNDSVNRCQELSENGDVILRTDNLYYVSYYEPPRPSEKLVVNIRHTNDEINPDGSKEIPHWRLRPVANCYTLEGTENLEDEVFTKRHQKPELEEKRRKRWDLQRMREQKLFERLREKGKPYPDNMKDEHQFFRSFYPALDDITHIEIADKVPVTAFGHPIPYIKPTDFELPWEMGEWPSTSSSSGEDNRHQKHRRVKRK